MIKEGKFGPQEAICFITISIVSKVFYTSPSMSAHLVGTASWYMTILSGVAASIGFIFIYFLLKRFPNKSITEIFTISLGKWCGFAFSAILAIVMISIASIRSREVADVLKVYTLPFTPHIYILAFFITTVAILSTLGLETIVRVSKITSYGMLFGFLLVLLLGQQHYSTHRLFPILGYGLDKTVIHGIRRGSVFGEIIFIPIFATSLQGIKYIKKIGTISLILSIFLISMALLSYTMTLPYYAASEVTSPMYEMATMINYGRFFQRFEPIILFIFTISSIISVVGAFFAFVTIYSIMFKIQDTRPVVLASSIIVFTIAISFNSISTVTFNSVQYLRNYGGIFFYGLPFITLIVAKLRRKGESKNA